MTKTYTIPCTRCNGEGFFQGHGTCFKCEGTKINTVTQATYKKYHSKKEGSSYAMFNKADGTISKLLDSDYKRATFVEANALNNPVLKLSLDGSEYIAIKYSHDYMLVLTELTKLFKSKEGTTLSNEEATQIVERAMSEN